MTQVPDPDDIFRVIEEDNEDLRNTEVKRLLPKLRAFKSHFTGSYNILANLITATRGKDNNFDRSTGTMSAMDRSREKLEQRFHKLEHCFNRMIALSHDDETADKLEADFVNIQERYAKVIQAVGQLMIDMIPPPATQQAQAGGQQHTLKPVDALKPGFTLSFEHSPTELAAWMAQFKAYYEASRLHILPAQQQHAYLRCNLHPDVWIAIQERITLTTRIFKNDLQLDEDSCEKLIEDTFQVRYPLIMRRYRFFTFERKGNQTFTNFYGRLIELASAAQLEKMGRNEYLIFRIISGINDPASVDKLLSIPQADFNLEEVHRVAVACEAAKNYTGLNNRPDNVSCKVSNKGFGQYRSASNTGDDSNASNQQQENDVQNEKGNYSQDYRSLTGSAKIKALKDSGKCVRCGKNAHAKDSLCPHLTTTCHKCGATGHISPVCARK